MHVSSHLNFLTIVHQNSWQNCGQAIPGWGLKGAKCHLSHPFLVACPFPGPRGIPHTSPQREVQDKPVRTSPSLNPLLIKVAKLLFVVYLKIQHEIFSENWVQLWKHKLEVEWSGLSSYRCWEVERTPPMPCPPSTSEPDMLLSLELIDTHLQVLSIWASALLWGGWP